MTDPTRPIPRDGSGPTLGQILTALGAPQPLTLATIAPELLDRALAMAGVGKTQFAYHAERLAEPDMLLSAVPAGYDLAIPVGPGRSAGYVMFADDDEALIVARNLAQRPGFPNARLLTHDDLSDDDEEDEEDYGGHVRWGGDEMPIPDDWDAPDVVWAIPTAADGRMYGYSTTAILEFITGHYGPDVAAEALAEIDADLEEQQR